MYITCWNCGIRCVGGLVDIIVCGGMAPALDITVGGPAGRAWGGRLIILGGPLTDGKTPGGAVLLGGPGNILGGGPELSINESQIKWLVKANVFHLEVSLK